MKLSPRHQFALLGAALVVLVALVFVQGGGADTPAAPPRLTPEAAPVAPSADNVAPAFHTQLMALEARVAEAPQDTAALLQLARLRQDAHQLEEAADAYERLLAVAPGHRQAHLDLALVYAESGRPDEARRVTEALLSRYPDDPSGRYNLGALHANAGDFDEARHHWQEVATQTRDAALAEQARNSLAQLDALATSGAPAGTAAGATLGPPPTMPPGHPPLPTFEPILVER